MVFLKLGQHDTFRVPPPYMARFLTPHNDGQNEL
jgi:hypothetical protein